jgi:acyl carrier protein
MNLTWDTNFAELLRGVLPALPAQAALTEQTALREYGLDSLATVELLVRLEEQYEVTIPDSLLTGAAFATPAALWQTLSSARGQGGQSGLGAQP